MLHQPKKSILIKVREMSSHFSARNICVMFPYFKFIRGGFGRGYKMASVNLRRRGCDTVDDILYRDYCVDNWENSFYDVTYVYKYLSIILSKEFVVELKLLKLNILFI